MDPERLESAKRAVANGMKLREAEEQFKISKSVLHRHIKLGKNIKKQGGQTVLSSGEEEILVQSLVLCASWGYPMDSYDLRLVVKGYLDRRGVDVKRFKGNMPGVDWAESFVMRHKYSLRGRTSQNIKRAKYQEKYYTIGIIRKEHVSHDETYGHGRIWPQKFY